MVNQRDGVIAKLRDEAYTLWASEWLAFRRRAANDFPGLDFNFQVPGEEKAKESVYEEKADPGVLSDTPSPVPLPSEVEVPIEAGSPLSLVGASPSDLHDLEARTSEVVRSSTSNIYAHLYNLCSFWLTSSSKPRTSVTLTLVLLFYGYPSFYILGFPVFFYDLC